MHPRPAGPSLVEKLNAKLDVPDSYIGKGCRGPERLILRDTTGPPYSDATLNSTNYTTQATLTLGEQDGSSRS